MDHNDRGRQLARRLPLPPQLTSPASTSKAPSIVSISSYYGSKPPPLSRKNVGSTDTKVIQPSTPPPVYGSLDASPFCEPQLVEEVLVINDSMPGLLPDDGVDNARGQVNSAWEGTQPALGTSTDTRNTDATPWEAQPYGGSSCQGPSIDGRDKFKEEHWWDAPIRNLHKRPGPGVLPPYLADLLHDPDHPLFAVSIDPPNFASGFVSSDGWHVGAPFQPPSVDDLAYSIPHPNAYYCRKHNSWVLLQWRSSTMMPPLAKSFVPETPFPNPARRKRTTSCVGEGKQPFGQVNLTHHFHHYEKAVDALKLYPAFRRSEWEIPVQMKQRRRKATSLNLDAISLDKMSDNAMEDSVPEEEGDSLDLYVCCQCGPVR